MESVFLRSCIYKNGTLQMSQRASMPRFWLHVVASFGKLTSSESPLMAVQSVCEGLSRAITWLGQHASRNHQYVNVSCVVQRFE